MQTQKAPKYPIVYINNLQLFMPMETALQIRDDFADYLNNGIDGINPHARRAKQYEFVVSEDMGKVTHKLVVNFESLQSYVIQEIEISSVGSHVLTALQTLSTNGVENSNYARF